MVRAGRAYIGTSGWSYGHWSGPFYPKDLPARNYLSHYAERFPSVEINGTFYNLPSAVTVEAWRQSVPKTFTFAVKASRFITHMKKLKDPAATLPPFMDRITGLRPKLGPILFQLPPNWRCNTERLAAFLDALPPRYRYAFEFRDDSWLCGEVYALLKRRRTAFCVFELAGMTTPFIDTAPFRYVRLHGPGGPYQGSYTTHAIKIWAGRAREWCAAGQDVYIYFDNDERGFAALNALEVKALVEK